MTKDEMKVFKRAEELLAHFQRAIYVPQEHRRWVRDYFSSQERGQVIALDRATDEEAE